MTDTATHLPPQSIEAEEAILGAMLMSETACDRAVDLKLLPENFYRPAHRTMFEVILELHAKGTADELTVVNRLRALGKLTEAGGQAAVMTLAERVPAIANAAAYAQEVIDQARLRGLVETGHEIARLGYEHPDEPEALWNQAAELVAGVDTAGAADDFVAMDDLLESLTDEWADRQANGGAVVGLPTGFPAFDNRIGGLQDGSFVVIAGRPGMGKTAFVMNIAEHVAIEEGGHVAIFNMEMEPADLTARLVSSVSKVNGGRLMNTAPVDEDWEHLHAAMQRIRDRAPGRLLVSRPFGLTPQGLRTRVRRLQRKLERKHHRLRLVIIDYIQLMEPGKRLQDRNAEISYISRHIKAMALELGIPVVALSQLNRQVEQRPDKRPHLGDLRDSGAIEQDADAVVLMFRPEYYTKDDTPPELIGKAEAIVAKLRRGEIGSVWLGWIGKYTKFVPLTPEGPK